MTAPEWLHYALYPGDGARLDRVVREVVAPAVARAGVAGPPRRWFFLRFTDELGPHVRLRFAGGQGAVDAIHQAVDPALRRALREVTAPPRERTPPGITGCHQGFYEPELDRYGGRAGVALAEAVFEVSSEVTLALLGRADVAARRRALALTLMRRAARSTLREADLPGLWTRYERHWSGGAGPAAATRRARYQELARARAARARERMAEVAADATVGRLLEAYAGALQVHRDRLAAGAVAHHVHLTNNRLGIPPAEEGYLARVLLVLDHAGPPGGAG